MITFKKISRNISKLEEALGNIPKLYKKYKTLCWLVDFIVMVDNFEPKQCKNNEGIFYI